MIAIDLPRCRMTELRLDARIGSDEQQPAIVASLEQFRKKRQRADEPTILTIAYEASDVLHHCVMLVGPPDEEHVFFHLMYSTWPSEVERPIRLGRSGSRAQHERFQEVLTTLGRFKYEASCHCQGQWEFEQATFRSVIQLPLMIFNDPMLPFSEISGVRLIKKEGTELKETVSLDVRSSGALRAVIHFNYQGMVDRDLPARVVEEAQVRVAKYVTRMSKEASDGTKT